MISFIAPPSVPPTQPSVLKFCRKPLFLARGFHRQPTTCFYYTSNSLLCHINLFFFSVKMLNHHCQTRPSFIRTKNSRCQKFQGSRSPEKQPPDTVAAPLPSAAQTLPYRKADKGPSPERFFHPKPRQWGKRTLPSGWQSPPTRQSIGETRFFYQKYGKL